MAARQRLSVVKSQALIRPLAEKLFGGECGFVASGVIVETHSWCVLGAQQVVPPMQETKQTSMAAQQRPSVVKSQALTGRLAEKLFRSECELFSFGVIVEAHS